MTSVAQSKASVTQSEVSMVDFKLQANKVKTTLKNLFKNLDGEKTGSVKQDVFF